MDEVVEDGADAGNLDVASAYPLLAKRQLWPTALRLSETHVYWANWGGPGTGGIARVSKQGGPVETLVQSPNRPDSLYLDDQFAYWAERWAPGSLRRMRLSDRAVEVLRDEASLFLWALAGDAIYFAEDGRTVISSLPKSGGREQVVITPNDPSAITSLQLLRVHDKHVYWVLQATPDPGNVTVSRLYRSALGSKQEELIAEEPVGLSAIEFDSERVYWTVTKVAGVVRSRSLAGGEPQTIARGEDHPGALAVDAERVYWTTRSGIRSARKDGSDAKTIASGLVSPIALAVDDQAVYWASYAADGTIGRASK